MSPDDFGFEPLDDELGRRLRAGAPTAPATEGALAALRPRFEHARRRRRAAVTGAWGVGLLGAVGLVLSLAVPGGGDSVRTPPASRPDGGTTTTAPTLSTTDPTIAVPGTGGTTATTDDHGGNRGPGGGGDDSGGGGSGTDSSGQGGD